MYVNSPEPVPDNDDGAGFVTTTSRPAPDEPAGVVHVTDVDDTTTTDEHAAPPTVAVAPATNPVPVTETGVPPAAEPDVGVIDVTAGGTEKVNSPEPVPASDDGAGFVTTMSRATPTLPEGVVHVTNVEETTTTDAHADPPTVTVAAATNPLPVTVIGVPPATEPDVGDTDDTTGGS